MPQRARTHWAHCAVDDPAHDIDVTVVKAVELRLRVGAQEDEGSGVEHDLHVVLVPVHLCGRVCEVGVGVSEEDGVGGGDGGRACGRTCHCRAP